MRLVPWIAVAVVASALVAGCAEPPRSGAVVGTETLTMAGGPRDIPFRTADGQTTTFARVRRPISLVAFSEAPGNQCCWLDPRLVRASESLNDVPVSVAQLSLPTSACGHGPGCSEVCRTNDWRLITLCDHDRLAWNAYGKPASGTVLLLNPKGEVIAQAPVSNMAGIVAQARRAADDYVGISSTQRRIQDY
jgi:hypothetical protein